VLHVYRRKVASPSQPGQLILPESLKLLPIYTLGIIKSPLLVAGTSVDERVYHLNNIPSMTANWSMAYAFPRLFTIVPGDELSGTYNEEGQFNLPDYSIVSSDFLAPENIYILDNGRRLFLRVGEQVPPDTMIGLFGAESLEGFDPYQVRSISHF
jgi:protein transport protein SEC24